MENKLDQATKEMLARIASRLMTSVAGQTPETPPKSGGLAKVNVSAGSKTIKSSTETIESGEIAEKKHGSQLQSDTHGMANSTKLLSHAFTSKPSEPSSFSTLATTFTPKKPADTLHAKTKPIAEASARLDPPVKAVASTQTLGPLLRGTPEQLELARTIQKSNTKPWHQSHNHLSLGQKEQVRTSIPEKRLLPAGSASRDIRSARLEALTLQPLREPPIAPENSPLEKKWTNFANSGATSSPSKSTAQLPAELASNSSSTMLTVMRADAKNRMSVYDTDSSDDGSKNRSSPESRTTTSSPVRHFGTDEPFGTTPFTFQPPKAPSIDVQAPMLIKYLPEVNKKDPEERLAVVSSAREKVACDKAALIKAISPDLNIIRRSTSHEDSTSSLEQLKDRIQVVAARVKSSGANSKTTPETSESDGPNLKKPEVDGPTRQNLEGNVSTSAQMNDDEHRSEKISNEEADGGSGEQWSKIDSIDKANEMLKQMHDTIERSKRAYNILHKDVQELMQEAERRRFLGTDSPFAPFSLKIKLPNQTVTVQATVQLKINQLCRRVITKAELDIHKITEPRVSFRGKQLAHLQTLGENGVVQETELFFTYKTL